MFENQDWILKIVVLSGFVLWQQTLGFALDSRRHMRTGGACLFSAPTGRCWPLAYEHEVLIQSKSGDQVVVLTAHPGHRFSSKFLKQIASACELGEKKWTKWKKLGTRWLVEATFNSLQNSLGREKILVSKIW